MAQTITSDERAGSIVCPHCRKRFDAELDLEQPPRLRGVKCPHCKLFVPERHIQAAKADEPVS